jgi:hypothetical protein
MQRDGPWLMGIRKRVQIPAATAIADRLVHRSEVLTMGGDLIEANRLKTTEIVQLKRAVQR